MSNEIEELDDNLIEVIIKYKDKIKDHIKNNNSFIEFLNKRIESKKAEYQNKIKNLETF